MSQLDKLKLTLGIKDDTQDDELTLLLEDVATDLLSWTHRIVIPPGLEPTQRQIAVIRYNMEGVEGQSSHSEGSVSRAFEALPADVRQTIVRYRLLKAVKLGAT